VTRKQVLLVAIIVLLASALSALVAYRHGARRAGVGSTPSVPIEVVEGPCVEFSAAEPLVGKSACVSGRILRVFTSRSGNTFLDFCADYRSCPFASVIFSEDRPKFGDLSQLQGRQVEVRGLVTYYNHRAEIIVHDSKQIRMAP
jgi:hypothetical protein